MALRFIDSVGHYNTRDLMMQKWTSVSTYISVGTGTGRNGGNVIQAGGNSQFFSKTLTNQPTWIVGFGFLLELLTSGTRYIVELVDNGTSQCNLALNANGTLSIRRGTTVLGTSTNSMIEGVWYFVEFKVTIANAGSASVRVNGVEWLSVSGDTQASAYAYASSINFQVPNAVSQNFCDIYICDGTGTSNNDFLGDCRVECLLPSGTGYYSQWTPSVGSNYECVDDNPANGNTDYVSSATPGQMDSYSFENLYTSAGVIKGIQTVIQARKDDAGTRSIRRLYRRGSDSLSAAVALSDSYAFLLEIMETDPIAAAAWTISNLNAAEFGQKMEA